MKNMKQLSKNKVMDTLTGIAIGIGMSFGLYYLLGMKKNNKVKSYETKNDNPRYK